MKINSRISKQKEKEYCYFWGSWKGSKPWALKRRQRLYISEPFSALDLANLNWVSSVCFLQIDGWGLISFGAMFHNPWLCMFKLWSVNVWRSDSQTYFQSLCFSCSLLDCETEWTSKKSSGSFRTQKVVLQKRMFGVFFGKNSVTLQNFPLLIYLKLMLLFWGTAASTAVN